MVKEWIIDYKRYSTDNETNNQKTQVWDSQAKKFKPMMWKQIQVGHIIQLTRKSQKVPADVLILASSSKNGQAFCKTTTLDGENNLKARSALPLTQSHYEKAENKSESRFDFINSFEYETIVSKPERDLQNFNLKIIDEKEHVIIPQGMSNILLRGASLAQTDEVIAVVLATGADTRIIMNSGKFVQKQSLQDFTQQMILILQVVQLVILMLIMAYMNYRWSTSDQIQQHFYLWDNMDVTFENQAFRVILSFFLLLNGIVSFAYIVVIEFGKLFQTPFLQYDVEMADQSGETDNKMKCLSYTLHEDLGLVRYILSDKTGTLTKNKLDFKAIHIGTKDYYEKGLNDHQVAQRVKEEFETVPEYESHEVFQILINICLCNDTVLYKDENGNSSIQGASPDEIELIRFAELCGFKIVKKTVDDVTLEVEIAGKKQEHTYKILEKYDFTSARKRMSVIAQKEGSSDIHIYTKGADDIMEKLCNQKFDDEHQSFFKTTMESVHHYSNDGLRTLVFGTRKLDSLSFYEWIDKVKHLKNQMGSTKDQIKAQLKELWDIQESDYKILGGSALEDELADEIEDCIECFKKAGIKVWMITGDKYNTAKSIGFSSKLIHADNKVFEFKADQTTDLQSKLDEILKQSKKHELATSGTLHDKERFKFNFSVKVAIEEVRQKLDQEYQNTNEENYSICIEGSVFQQICADPDLSYKFALAATLSEGVIICRATPNEKAQAVQMLKQYLKKSKKFDEDRDSILAIGDGSNDVAMILQSHVGIGIYGKEGTEAVSNADYAICEFKHLKKLILHHGMNIANKIGYFCYLFLFKSAIFGYQNLFFAFHSGYSGKSVQEDTYYGLYHIINTNFNIGFWFVFDQMVCLIAKDPMTELIRPHVYDQLRSESQITYKRYVRWMIYWFIASIPIFYVPMLSYHNGQGSWDGYQGYDLDWLQAMVCSFVVMVSVSMTQVLSYTYSFTFLLLLFYLVSGLSVPLSINMNHGIERADQYMGSWEMLSQPLFYLTLVAAVAIVHIPLMMAKRWAQILHPTYFDIARR